MSRLARRQFTAFGPREYEEIAQRKRHYYQRLAEYLGSVKGITVLWPQLPEGAVPFCLSMLVDEHRDRLFDALRRRYEVMAWPTLPSLVLDQLDDFPDVKRLGRTLLQFNLPADKVQWPTYPAHLESFVRDLSDLRQDGHSVD